MNKINQKHLNQFKKYWQAQLSALVGDLPEFEKITEAIIINIKNIFKP